MLTILKHQNNILIESKTKILSKELDFTDCKLSGLTFNLFNQQIISELNKCLAEYIDWIDDDQITILYNDLIIIPLIPSKDNLSILETESKLKEILIMCKENISDKCEMLSQDDNWKQTILDEKLNYVQDEIKWIINISNLDRLIFIEDFLTERITKEEYKQKEIEQYNICIEKINKLIKNYTNTLKKDIIF